VSARAKNLERIAREIDPITFNMNEVPSEKPKKPFASEPVVAQRAGSFVGASHFRYYIHDAITACRLQLIGELTEAEISDLNGCWRTARTTLGTRSLILDLYALKSVDEAGKQWLASMAQEGAICSPEGYLRDLVAGKHTAGKEAALPAAKPGLFARILGLLRGVGVEAAK
jgi:hypothetical protein